MVVSSRKMRPWDIVTAKLLLCLKTVVLTIHYLFSGQNPKIGYLFSLVLKKLLSVKSIMVLANTNGTEEP